MTFISSPLPLAPAPLPGRPLAPASYAAGASLRRRLEPSARTATSRRVFIRSAAFAALASAGAKSVSTGLAALAGRESAPVSQGENGRAIDAHVHIWTPDTRRYPLAAGFAEKDMAPPSFTPEELFAHCRPQGVDRVVLIQMSFYRFDNRYMLDMMEKYPGTFRGVAIIDETQADLRAAMNRLATKGVRGFRLYADREKAEAWSDSAGMNAMWTCAADAGMAVCLLADPGALPAVHRMCLRFPKTPVVIDHFARIGMKGAMRQSDIDNLCRLADFEHTHVKTSAFYALGAKKAPYTDMAPLVRQLRSAYGASRLMWASDCPFQVQGGHTYADSIALIRDRLDFLSAEDKAWMLRKTAEGLFFG